MAQRNAAGELVVNNSTVWLSIVCGVIAAILIYAAFASGDNRLFRPALFLGIFIVAFLSKYKFVFDPTQRMVRWQIMRFGWRRTGSMPFDEVKDVVLQSAAGTGRATYRLAMLTTNGAMPLSSGYGGTSERCLALQSQILQLLRPGQAMPPAAAPASSIAASLESSARTLVAQGRKIDAIKLLTSMGVSLSDATQQVDEIEKQQVG